MCHHSAGGVIQLCLHEAQLQWVLRPFAFEQQRHFAHEMLSWKAGSSAPVVLLANRMPQMPSKVGTHGGDDAGQFDAQDGPGSVEAWTTNLDWPGKADFFQAKRHIWRMGPGTSNFLQDVEDSSGSASNASQNDSRTADGILQLAQHTPAGTMKLQPVAGYWKHHQLLTTVVIKDAGHMVPRDQPLVAQTMIEAWVQHSLGHQ